MKSTTSGCIVLMNRVYYHSGSERSCGEGFVVCGENLGGKGVGFFNNAWEIDLFDDYNEEVVLKNI